MSILDSFRLDGRVALVTASTGGLGLEMARGFAEAGATVAINGRDARRAEPVAEALRGEGLAVEALAFDAGDPDAVCAAIDRLAASRGRLDILVNTIGVRSRRPAARTPTADFAALLAVNLTAVYAATRHAAEIMAAAGGGRIVQVSSIVARLVRSPDPAYVAAKAALEALTRSFALEYARRGVLCNAIAPGYFATETNREFIDHPKIGPSMTARVPLGRWAAPREIAATAVFLASDAGSYVTGQTLVVDGGICATA